MHAAIWQLGSYIWVPPPETPQGLAQLYVRTQLLCKEKSAEPVEFQQDCGNVPPRGNAERLFGQLPNRFQVFVPGLYRRASLRALRFLPLLGS
jgi:hypothetical protein